MESKTREGPRGRSIDNICENFKVKNLRGSDMWDNI